MSEDTTEDFDKYFKKVKKDRRKIEQILAGNEDMHDELMPLLKTALWLEDIDHPEMPPEQKQKFRKTTTANIPKRPEQTPES